MITGGNGFIFALNGRPMSAALLKALKNRAASTKSRYRKKAEFLRAIEMGEASNQNARQSLPRYLAVAPSTIPNAGNGVFAVKNFAKNTIILLCGGSYVLSRDQSIQQERYSFMVPGYESLSFQCYDDAETNIVKYINSNHKTNKKQNCEILWHGALPFLYALSDIRKGDELFLNYDVL